MLKVESYRKGILLSSIFNIASKGFLFVNSLAIAFYFGTQIKMDIYFYCYNTIVIIATLISGANSSVIIPESLRIRIKDGDTAANAFLNTFIYGYIALTGLLCIIFSLNPVGIFHVFSNYEEEVLQSYRDIIYLSIPLLLLISLTTLLTDILASCRYFTVPVLASMLNSLVSLVFLITLTRFLDIRSILIGLLVSNSINILALAALMKKKLNWNFRPKKPSLRKTVVQNILYSQSGNLLTSLSTYAPLYFLSGTVFGIIASLNYAQQLVAQANSFITNQISIISRIRLSELYAKRRYKQLNQIFLSTIKFLIYILVPVSALICLYAEEIVTILFKRGSFDKESVTLTSSLLRLLVLALPLTAIISIAGNLYVAAQLIKVSIMYQIASNLVLIALVAVAVAEWGYIGYPIAVLVMNTINVLVVSLYCKFFFPFIHYYRVINYLLLVIGLNLILCLIAALIKQTTGEIIPYFGMIVSGTTYLAVIVFLGWKFNLNDDLNEIVFKITNRFGITRKNLN